MIAASEPLSHERALADLKAMLYAAQHARSVMSENGWLGDEDEDNLGRRVLADTQPWLFDEQRCIVLLLAKLIERCEKAGGKVQPIDYYNMLLIAQKTPAIAVGCMMLADRELPQPDIGSIMKALGSLE